MRRTALTLLCLLLTLCAGAADKKLTGTSIGTSKGYDYSTSAASTTVNLRANALDGNLATYFASNRTSKGWVGLDLGKPCVISQVGWAPAGVSAGPNRTLLGLFEGANQSDFTDAVPLYLISEALTGGEMHYAPVQVSRGFRYVRYIGPADARCNIAEVEFWGHAGEGDDSQFYQVTNLPTVSIHNLSGADPQDKVTELEGNLVITYDGGTRIQEYPITDRGRGNASWEFPKKPYRIKFNDGDSHHMLKDSPLESPSKAKKWTLINNYGDKTLLRNVLAFEISRRMGLGYTPWCQPVDLILNGEYKGCYQLCDQVEVHKGRVDVEKMDSTCIEGDALTGGYLLEIDAHATEEPKYFTTTRNTPVTIKYPDEDDLLDVQYNYIKQYYQTLETTLFRATIWKDAEQGYRHYLNLPSFLRHFLVGELSGNRDTYWSTCMYKDRTETQFFVEPVWDFDLAFENDYKSYPTCNLSDYVYRTIGSHAGNFNTIVDRIVVYDVTALKEMRELWATVRLYNNLNAESLQLFVDSVAAELQQSQKLNFIRWPIMNTKVHANPVIWGSYDAEVQNVRDYLGLRFTWMDNKLRYATTVTGIRENPTAEHVEQEIHLWGRQLNITGLPGGTPYQVYTPSGALQFSGTTGTLSPRLAPGLHLIHIVGKTVKLMVK